MMAASEFVCQATRTLAGPTQRGCRVAASRRFDQDFQGSHQTGVRLGQGRPSAARSPHPGSFGCSLSSGQIQLPQASRDRGAGQTSGMRYRSDAAPAQLACLHRRPVSTPTFVHLHTEGAILSSNTPDGLYILHPTTSSTLRQRVQQKIVQVIIERVLSSEQSGHSHRNGFTRVLRHASTFLRPFAPRALPRFITPMDVLTPERAALRLDVQHEHRRTPLRYP